MAAELTSKQRKAQQKKLHDAMRDIHNRLTNGDATTFSERNRLNMYNKAFRKNNK